MRVRKRGVIFEKITVGSMKTNCYIFGDLEARKAFIIDPGGDYEKIKAAIDGYGLKVISIINTHGHADHIGANKYLGFPIWIHKDDSAFLRDPRKNLSSLLGFSLISPEAARELEDGDTLKAGSVLVEVMHTPGHTPGSICLKALGMLFTGDTLFYSGVGRTDFPYGSQEALHLSLKEKVLKQPDNTAVYPGHGPATTIGKEKKGNPFL